MRRFAIAAAIAFVLTPSLASADTIVDGGNVINQIWTPAGSPYRLRGDVTVPVGAFLYIEAGTTITVDTGDLQGAGIDPNKTELRIHGVLHADGTAQAPIAMRGQGQIGTWYGLVSYFGAVQTRLRHVAIEDTTVGITSGSDGEGLDVASVAVTRSLHGIQIEVGTPHLRDVVISEGFTSVASGSTGLRVLWGSAPTASRITIVGYRLGVDTWDSSLTLNNCVIRGNIDSGIQFAPHVTRRLEVHHCTIHGNGLVGVYVRGAPADAQGGSALIANSIVTRNGHGIARNDQAEVIVRFSDVWGSYSNNYSNVTPEPNCISVNPQFVSDVDFHLRPSSQCIDTCPSGLRDDRDGALRPANGDGLGDARWDMGAYEHPGAVHRCGDGVVDPGEACDSGPRNGEYDQCNDACTGTAGDCGDGVVNGPEQCDDANAVDTDACLNTCRLATCGDGFVWSGAEGCDDGNRVEGDACTNTCALATCGDGITWSGHEDCDDGNRVEGDACLTTCVAATCGDGITWAGHEECDDGNRVGTDGCTAACTAARCGDGITWAGHEACDDGNRVEGDACLTTCQTASCGDGVLWADVEQCDDGNRVGTDGCTAACTIARCGDGVVHDGFEQCDDGNASSTDACVDDCHAATCGDSFVRDGVEACDDGNSSNSDGCTTACALPTCGDGFVQAGEQCDDANADDGDACLHTCVAASCGDGFVRRGEEQCDDGNRDDGDGCSAACVVETPDAGVPDAGVPDAGVPDAALPDAAVRPDAAIEPDAAIGPDAALVPDAALAPDAALPEPCDTDAAPGTADATTRPDAVDNGDGGGGCQTGRGSLPGAALLVLGALLTGRRRRAASLDS